MSGRVGQLAGEELWFRCPFCGDSNSNSLKTHFSINVRTGLYHCFRCKEKGRMGSQQLMKLLVSAGLDLGVVERRQIKPILDPEDIDVLPGPGSPRSSRLARGHAYHSLHPGEPAKAWDVFQMRDPAEPEFLLGYMLRRPGESIAVGVSGYGWEAPDQFPLSSPEEPIRVVEGPYDVLYKKDVCVFGTISSSKLGDLRSHYLVLCPDGDIWTNPTLRRSFLKLLRMVTYSLQDPLVIGIELLPDGKDPDEVPEDKRELVPREDFPRFLGHFNWRPTRRNKLLRGVDHDY